jgi:peptide/nickel transport system permease protein
MTLFIIRRLGTLLVVLFGASMVIFAVMRFLPGDPVLAMLGFDTDPAELGLDQPIIVQYGVWLLDCLQGDLGASIFLKRDVSELLALRFPMTLALALASLVVALAVAIPAGVLSASRRGRWVDHATRIIGSVSPASRCPTSGSACC